jgi:hypothetical protein
VAVVLFVSVNRGDAPGDLPTVTDPSDADTDATGEVVGTDEPAVAGDGADDASVPSAIEAADARIVTVQAWDPDGDNGSENDAQAIHAIADGSESTMWSTECYQDRYLGGKSGVGLILGLNGVATGTLSVESANGPYQIDIMTATGAAAPAKLDGWSKVGDTRFSDSPGTIDVEITEPANYLLVWLKELGPDEVCTSANPYRGRLGEISFGP